MPIEQDYFDTLESYGEALMDFIVAMCGWITRIEDLCIACESAPDFNGRRGENGVMISTKLREYLAYGKG